MFPGADHRIELYNYDADQWELMDARESTANDSVTVVRVVDDPSRFTEPGTGVMEARLGFRDNTAPLFTWFARIDQAVWVVTPK